MLTHSDVWWAIDRLAAKHGMSASGLARRAGLDPTTFNKSKRITREGKQRWPSTESVAKILAATGASLSDFVILIGDDQSAALSRKIPFMSLEQADQDGVLDAGGQPAGDGWDAILFPQLTDPDAYALEITNDRLAPVYREGDVIVLSPRANIRRGDRVILKLRDGTVLAGQFVRKGMRKVQLAPLSGGPADRVLDANQVAWISRVLWASQ
jgi:phage repressor protein C with HTH and peptisase S24 domain